MIFNSLWGFWCENCKKYIDPYTEVYLPDGSENEGRVCCLKCDSEIGFTWDRVWVELFGEENG